MAYCPHCATPLLPLCDPATGDTWQGCPECGWMQPDTVLAPADDR